MTHDFQDCRHTDPMVEQAKPLDQRIKEGVHHSLTNSAQETWSRPARDQEAANRSREGAATTPRRK